METEELYKRLCNYKEQKTLPDERFLLELGDEAASVLEAESPIYRPRDKKGRSGGLLDFSKDGRSVIIVPDIHARRDFIFRILSHKINSKRILDLVADEEVIMVCVGDAVHAETIPFARDRWLRAYEGFENGNTGNDAMKEEMTDSLYTVAMLMELKKEFPLSFHFLKGNHENITNSSENGDHAFRKFALEGAMVKEFITDYYSEALLHVLNCYESNLSLAAIFDTFAVSHAEPRETYTREEIVNYHEHPDVIDGFTWTANDEAEEGSVINTFKNLNPLADMERILWFGGHRPVKGELEKRQQGRYIQIHNPDLMNIVVMDRKRIFDPETSIIRL